MKWVELGVVFEANLLGNSEANDSQGVTLRCRDERPALLANAETESHKTLQHSNGLGFSEDSQNWRVCHSMVVIYG